MVTLTVRVGEASAEMTLPKGEPFDLGAPALPGQAFVGWCINEATTPETSTTFTATTDATFTALYQPMALITLTYEGCSGAPTLPPGGQTYLYPTGDRPIRSWRVCINGTERPDCLQDGLLTLPPDAQTVTVTALPNAPGYLMRFAAHEAQFPVPSFQFPVGGCAAAIAPSALFSCKFVQFVVPILRFPAA
jgi:hypothetical protein